MKLSLQDMVVIGLICSVILALGYIMVKIIDYFFERKIACVDTLKYACSKFVKDYEKRQSLDEAVRLVHSLPPGFVYMVFRCYLKEINSSKQE